MLERNFVYSSFERSFMKELKKLPDRAELRAAALKRLEKPSSRILSGVVLGNYSAGGLASRKRVE